MDSCISDHNCRKSPPPHDVFGHEAESENGTVDSDTAVEFFDSQSWVVSNSDDNDDFLSVDADFTPCCFRILGEYESCAALFGFKGNESQNGEVTSHVEYVPFNQRKRLIDLFREEDKEEEEKLRLGRNQIMQHQNAVRGITNVNETVLPRPCSSGPSKISLGRKFCRERKRRTKHWKSEKERKRKVTPCCYSFRWCTIIDVRSKG